MKSIWRSYIPHLRFLTVSITSRVLLCSNTLYRVLVCYVMLQRLIPSTRYDQVRPDVVPDGHCAVSQIQCVFILTLVQLPDG